MSKANISKAIFVAVQILLSFSIAEAQFVRVNRNVYGDISRKLFVVTVSEELKAPGLFIAASPEEIPFDRFKPTLPELRSIFVGFDKKQNKFVDVVLPNGSRVPLNGNVSIQLGEGAQVDIDLRFNPYLSVSSTPANGSHSLLGFMGSLSPFLNVGGRTTVSALSAHPIPSEFQTAVKPYSIDNLGRLSSEGQSLDLKVLGMNFTNQHTCILQGTPMLNPTQLQQLEGMKDPREIREVLKQVVSGYEKNNPFDGVLFLGVRQLSLSVFYPKNNDFLLIEEIPQRIAGTKVCRVTPVAVELRG